MPFNPFDVIIILVLLLSGFLAMIRGFTREVLSIFAWVGAAIATGALFPYARPFSRAVMTPDWLADAVSGIVIFIVSVALLSFLSHAISRQIKGSPVGALDHTLGFIFGLARGGLLAVIAFLAIGWLLTERPAWLLEARTLPLLETGAGLVMGLSPNRQVEVPEMLKIPSPLNTIPGSPEPDAKAADSPDKTGYKSGDQRAFEQLIRGGDASK